MTSTSHPVLIETSIWITHLHRRNQVLQSAVTELIRSGQAVTCGAVVTELVSGESQSNAQERILTALGGLRYLECTYETWLNAGRVGAQLRAQGAGIPLPDLLIAALAIQHGCAIYTLD
ncbi:MAG: PIN domain-containing protein, partial [Chloroflexi bacterium]|nr:PIN domain-containing protein [Chloroflexota bacterium]